MANYFIIGPALLQHEAVSAPVLCSVGDIVKYAGPPNPAMVPVDADAVEAKRLVAEQQSEKARRLDVLLERRLRSRLPKPLATKLARLEAELRPQEVA